MTPHDVLIDALAAARLEKAGLSDRDLRRGAPSWTASNRLGPRPWETDPLMTMTGPSLRVRLGHGLLALGAALAGDDESARAGRVA
jgi:hypothetical protein